MDRRSELSVEGRAGRVGEGAVPPSRRVLADRRLDRKASPPNAFLGDGNNFRSKAVGVLQHDRLIATLGRDLIEAARLVPDPPLNDLDCSILLNILRLVPD